MRALLPSVVLSLCLPACGDDQPSGSEGADETSGAATSGAATNGAATGSNAPTTSAADGAESNGGSSGSFFRFDVSRGGQSFSVDSLCSFPFVPVPGNVNFSGDDPDQGVGLQLAWDAPAVPSPGTYEVNPGLILFNGGSKGLRISLDETINLTVVESNRWAGDMPAASFSDENGGDTILVENVVFDCRLD